MIFGISDSLVNKAVAAFVTISLASVARPRFSG
jgi:hypothetical protein